MRAQERQTAAQARDAKPRGSSSRPACSWQSNQMQPFGGSRGQDRHQHHDQPNLDRDHGNRGY